MKTGLESFLLVFVSLIALSINNVFASNSCVGLYGTNLLHQAESTSVAACQSNSTTEYYNIFGETHPDLTVGSWGFHSQQIGGWTLTDIYWAPIVEAPWFQLTVTFKHCMEGASWVSTGNFDGYCEFACPSNEVWNGTSCEVPASDKAKGPDNTCPVGEHTDPGTGNTSFSETEAFHTRTKNNPTSTSSSSPLGKGWTANNFQTLGVNIASQQQTVLKLERPDGRVEFFDCAQSTCVGDQDTQLTVNKVLDPLTSQTTGFEVYTADNILESYSPEGQLLSTTDTSGQVTSMGYDISDQLETVTDHFGRVTTYSYLNGKVATMTDPDGQIYHYDYDANDNLIKVTYPDDTPGTLTDNPFKEYLYEDISFPNHITGVINENGDRINTWGYDTQGRALYSELTNGLSRVDLTYNTGGTTTVTDALGAVNTFTFTDVAGVARPTTITGGPCGSGCSGQSQSAIYNIFNGDLFSRTDFEGNETRFNTYNSRRLETSRTEAYGTVDARTITTDWHASLRLPIKITEPGKETTFTYTATGLMLTRTETDTTTLDTRTTTYTYDTNGNVLTIDGPRTDIDDITTYTYDTMGNRASMSIDPDGAGPEPAHVTNYTSYDNSGRLLSMTDPNGVVTDLTYDERGRLLTRTIAPGTSGIATTTFEYDDVGNLTKLITPDSNELIYIYDSANRLIEINDRQGNSIEYTLDDQNNRTQEDIYQSNGVLRKTQTRMFNSLSRLIHDIDSNNETTIYGYDDNGNLISTTDANTHNSTSNYDIGSDFDLTPLCELIAVTR